MAEAAQMLGVDPKTAKRMCTSGKLDYYKTDGGHWRVYVAGIEAIRRGDNGTQGSSNGNHFPSPNEQKRERIQELQLEVQMRKAKRAVQELEAEERAEAEQQEAARREQERKERRARQEIEAERS